MIDKELNDSLETIYKLIIEDIIKSDNLPKDSVFRGLSDITELIYEHSAAHIKCTLTMEFVNSDQIYKAKLDKNEESNFILYKDDKNFVIEVMIDSVNEVFLVIKDIYIKRGNIK